MEQTGEEWTGLGVSSLESHLHKWLFWVLTLTQQGIWTKSPNYHCCCWKSEAGFGMTNCRSANTCRVYKVFKCLKSVHMLMCPRTSPAPWGMLKKAPQSEARLTLSSGPNWKQTLETKPCWGTWVSQLQHKGQWGTMTSHCQGGGLELVRVGTHERVIKMKNKKDPNPHDSREHRMPPPVPPMICSPSCILIWKLFSSLILF